MDFEDGRLEGIAVNNPESLYKLVVEELCGEKYYAPFDENISLQLSDRRLTSSSHHWSLIHIDSRVA